MKGHPSFVNGSMDRLNSLTSEIAGRIAAVSVVRRSKIAVSHCLIAPLLARHCLDYTGIGGVSAGSEISLIAWEKSHGDPRGVTRWGRVAAH